MESVTTIQRMKGLTLYQPWASHVAEGRKLWETRGWATRYRGLLAIHAGKSREFIGPMTNVPTGAVLALARVWCSRPTELVKVSDEERELGDYTPGRYAWGLTDVMKLCEPVLVKGSRMLWTLPREIEGPLARDYEHWLATQNSPDRTESWKV